MAPATPPYVAYIVPYSPFSFAANPFCNPLFDPVRTLSNGGGGGRSGVWWAHHYYKEWSNPGGGGGVYVVSTDRDVPLIWVCLFSHLVRVWVGNSCSMYLHG